MLVSVPVPGFADLSSSYVQLHDEGVGKEDVLLLEACLVNRDLMLLRDCPVTSDLHTAAHSCYRWRYPQQQ